MIPALSTRLAEAPGRKDEAVMGLAELAAVAAGAGYGALSMRASQVGVGAPQARVAGARRTLEGAGLRVSMVTGTVSLAANDAQAGAPLRHITPHLDLAQALGCTLIRVMLQRSDDLPWAQRAADEAAERGLRLAHQTHVGTLLETVDEAIDVVARVGRPAFGLTYEPSNLLVCDSPYGPEAIKRLAPHLFNVYLQNWHRHAAGSTAVGTNRGQIRVDQIPLDDRRGIDLAAVFDGLHAIGWRGYVTVHQVLLAGETVPEAATRHLAAIRPYLTL